MRTAQPLPGDVSDAELFAVALESSGDRIWTRWGSIREDDYEPGIRPRRTPQGAVGFLTVTKPSEAADSLGTEADGSTTRFCFR